MDKKNSVQFGVVMTAPNQKPIVVYIFSNHAATISQSLLMKLLKRESCRTDPEVLLSKLYLEIIDHQINEALGVNDLRVGVKMFVNVNQMFIVDLWKNKLHSTCMETRDGNFRMTIDEFLTDYEKRAQL